MNIHEMISQMNLRDIQFLRSDDTLLEMALALAKHNIGSLLVMDESDDLVGIVSERDLARSISKFPNDVAQRAISEIMTRSVITCTLSDDVLETLNLMNEKGIRHMPVVDDGRPIAVISIREFDYACKRLRTLAHTDELTGLSIRRHFMQSLEAEFSRYNRFDDQFCVAIMDIDKFKPINDTYGHDAGDQVLKALAGIFKSGLRKYDIVGRLGGEEFGIILPNTSGSEAVMACEHVANAIRASEVITDKGVIKFTASFGIAVVNNKEWESTSILIEADERLYEAKEGGRDRIVIGESDGPDDSGDVLKYDLEKVTQVKTA